jgi:hypothetical protein
MLRLEHDVDGIDLNERSDDDSTGSPTTARSAPVTPTHNHGNSVDVAYSDDSQRGFFEGLLGCLRPVWTIIGKAAAAELKQQGELSLGVVVHRLYCQISLIEFVLPISALPMTEI